MDFKKLETFKFSELRRIAADMDLPKQKDSAGYLKVITAAFREYEKYKRDKIDRYTKLHQLGTQGKEGTVYLVRDNRTGKEHAMKCFRESKSSKTLLREITLQKEASEIGVCPKILDYDTISKYIVMEKLDQRLYDIMKKKDGALSHNYQKQMISIFDKLDGIGIFHNDASPLNFMVNGKKLYIIDFGFARKVDSYLVKKYDTRKPNMKFMPVGFLLKMREIIPSIRYEVIEQNIHADVKDAAPHARRKKKKLEK